MGRLCGRVCVRNVWILVSVATVIGLFPLVNEMFRMDFTQHVVAWFVSGIFVLLSVPISLFGILMHLNHWEQPELQRYCIRILWMVPIYAGCSWLALRFKDAAIYLNLGRECYEGYVLYSFTFFLIRCLGSEEEASAKLAAHPPVQHMFPFCFLPQWPMGREFLTRCKNGVLFFALMKALMGLSAAILEAYGMYHDGDLEPAFGYFWLCILNNLTCTWALYCLVMFYHAARDDLAFIKPLPKFICIKAILFFSFWQSVMIALLVKLDIITQQDDWTSSYDVKSVAIGLQDFIICLEMFVAAIAHVWAFSHEEFQLHAADRIRLTWTQKLCSIFDVSDVKQDMYHHIQDVASGVGGIVKTSVQAPFRIIRTRASPNDRPDQHNHLDAAPVANDNHDNSDNHDNHDSHDNYAPPELR